MITDGNLQRASREGLERLGNWLGARTWEAKPKLTLVEEMLLFRVVEELEGEDDADV